MAITSYRATGLASIAKYPKGSTPKLYNYSQIIEPQPTLSDEEWELFQPIITMFRVGGKTAEKAMKILNKDMSYMDWMRRRETIRQWEKQKNTTRRKKNEKHANMNVRRKCGKHEGNYKIMTKVYFKNTELYEVVRFSQRTEKLRHKAWLEERRKGVGGSDVPAILGVSPWTTPYQVWLDKTGRKEPDDLSTSLAVQMGVNNEPLLRKRFKTDHPDLIVVDGTNKSLISKQRQYMHASLDGLLYDPKKDSYGILEIKCVSADKEHSDWMDEDGTHVIPPYYLAQVTHYMAVTGYTWGYVRVAFGNRKDVDIYFTRDEQDITTVVNAVTDFWTNYVEKDTPPQLQTMQDVQTAYPEDDGTLVETTDETFNTLAGKYFFYQQAEANARKLKEEIKTQLASMVGTSQGLISERFKVTYKTSHRKEHTVTYPESTVRTIRVSEIKEKDEQ